jgi:hypothetical protein
LILSKFRKYVFVSCIALKSLTYFIKNNLSFKLKKRVGLSKDVSG